MKSEKLNSWLSLGANFGVVVGLILLIIEDGLCLPWISGDLNSKPLQQTPVSEDASESESGSNGHKVVG